MHILVTTCIEYTLETAKITEGNITHHHVT